MKAKSGLRAIIIGDPSDPHVETVTKGLACAGTVVVDACSLPSLLVELTEDGWLLRDLTGSPVLIEPGRLTRGWIRRYAPPGWESGAVLGGHRAAVLSARFALLGALMRSDAIEWLSKSDDIAAAENKVHQYKTASNLGIRHPKTVILTDPLVAAEKLGNPFVVKPLGVGNFVEQGVQKLVFAESVEAEKLLAVDLGEAPFLMQEKIIAKSHLRVVTVGKEVWVCELPAHGVPLDWRRQPSAHRSFKASREFSSVAGMALRLAEALRAGYSSQDWIVDKDGPVFVDFNPAGQWAFLPEEIAAPVAQKLIDWFAGGEG